MTATGNNAPAPEGAPGGVSQERTVVSIRDPQAIRALAHKVRLDVIDELFGADETYTATELAKRFGLTPSAMSYHLRALEKWGYVVRAESSGDGRERRWKAAGDSLSVGNNATASDLIGSTLIDLQLASLRDRILAALATSSSADEDAPEDVLIAQSRLKLTADEAKEFSVKYQELVQSFRHRSHPQGGDEVKRMHLTCVFVPEILQ